MNDNVIKQSVKEKAKAVRAIARLKRIPFESYPHLLIRARKKMGIKI